MAPKKPLFGSEHGVRPYSPSWAGSIVVALLSCQYKVTRACVYISRSTPRAKSMFISISVYACI